MHHFWFCFIYHRWGSLDQPIFWWNWYIPGELCYNFCIPNDLTQMVNFPKDPWLWLAILLFQIYFYLLTLVFVLQCFPSIGEFGSGCCQFPLNSQQDALFHCIACDYCCDSKNLRDVPWEDIFKLGASAAASEFCEWVQVGIDVYIPHRKYQVKPHSSPWFSAACAAAVVHKNLFFCLYQQNKSSKYKAKFIQASNSCKRVLEAAKLAMIIKQKSLSFLPETFLSRYWANCQ